jgi:hypothetical protein
MWALPLTCSADAINGCALRSVSTDFEMNLNGVDSAVHQAVRQRTQIQFESRRVKNKKSEKIPLKRFSTWGSKFTP